VTGPLAPGRGLARNRINQRGDDEPADCGVSPDRLAEVLTALLSAGWVTRAPGQRAIQLIPGGRQALSARPGLDL
jgi:hypothetical protein